jgi:hypothetical protein
MYQPGEAVLPAVGGFQKIHANSSRIRSKTLEILEANQILSKHQLLILS